MKLNENPEFVTLADTHYLYVEKTGPFHDTAEKAWQELRDRLLDIQELYDITAYMTLYRYMPNRVYRAGVAVGTKPTKLPRGIAYAKLGGGRYSRFVATGPWSELPTANGQVFDILSKQNIKLRDDFHIERYVNDLRTATDESLVTHILMAT